MITKNVANYLSISRIIFSIILIFIRPFCMLFCIIYFYCGISDILDGFIARKYNIISYVGSLLDSVGDFIFVVVAMLKIIPVLNLYSGVIFWMYIIALIKFYNFIFIYLCCNKILFLHTTMNKIVGFSLFISPIFLKDNNLLIQVILCLLATFSAIQEIYYIKCKRFCSK